jgi:hypothetical protein
LPMYRLLCCSLRSPLLNPEPPIPPIVEPVQALTD